VFTHGDLQITHVFVDCDEVTGVIDWSEARQGVVLYDLASLTLGHEERLGDVAAGYGADVDLDVIRGWWSLRSLRAARWLMEHGFDPSSPGCEFAVLRSAREGSVTAHTARAKRYPLVTSHAAPPTASAALLVQPRFSHQHRCPANRIQVGPRRRSTAAKYCSEIATVWRAATAIADSRA